MTGKAKHEKQNPNFQLVTSRLHFFLNNDFTRAPLTEFLPLGFLIYVLCIYICISNCGVHKKILTREF